MRLTHISSVIVVTLGLQGCAAGLFLKDKMEHFWLARWDAHESALVADLSVQAHGSILICDPDKNTRDQQVAVISNLVRSARHLNAYSRTLPDDNSPVITVAKNIEDASIEFLNRAQTKMSRVYCENKATNIQSMTDQAQRAVQSKRR